MQRVTQAGRSAVAWAALLVLASSLGTGAAHADEAVLDIWAASSLRQPVTQLAKAFAAAAPGRKLNLVFGASNALARQIQAGAPADAFLSADDVTIDRLQASGLVKPGTRRVFASNRLVVIAASELKGPLAAAQDLLRPEVKRLALAAPEVPAGRYAREWLEREGLAQALKGRILVLDDVRATLSSVESGNAEAGIVYASEARRAKSARVAFEVPASEQPYIVYVGAVMVGGDQPDLADAFLKQLLSAEGLAVLRAAGFDPPPAASSSPDAE